MKPRINNLHSRLFFGWWIVGFGGAIQFYTSAVFYRGFAAFFLAMINTFGWSSGATAAAISINRLEGGMISPFVGALIDRFGPRKLMIFGVGVTGLSFILMSRVQSLWQFYLVVILLTVGMSFGTFMVLVVTVGNWFVRNRSRALGILMATSALGGLTLPIVTTAIESFGWRDVLFAVGVGYWVIGFPASLFMRHSPEQYNMLPDGQKEIPSHCKKSGTLSGRSSSSSTNESEISVRSALKMRFFWQLTIGTCVGYFVSASNLTHLQAFETFGIDLTTGAFAVGAVAIGDIAGRASMAVVGDRLDKRLLLSIAYTMQTFGILALALVNFELFGLSLGLIPVPIYAIGFGFGFGASIPIKLAILADYYGRRSYGSLLGISSSVASLFGAGGAFFAGAMYDFTGSYRIPFLFMGIMLSIAIPLSLWLQSQERVAAIARKSNELKKI